VQVFRQRINALYTGAVEEVRGSGVELLPEDYAWLWDLSKAAVDFGRDIPDLLGVPVRVGPLTLHSYTLGAFLWWREASAWFAEGAESMLAMAWMLVHSDPAEEGRAFKDAGTRFRARSTVWWWAFRLPMRLSLRQLDLAVAVALGLRDGEFVSLRAPGERATVPQPTVSDYGLFVTRLCALRHLKPEEVLWGMPMADATALAKIDAEGRIQDDAGTREFAALRAAVQHLKQRKAAPA